MVGIKNVYPLAVITNPARAAAAAWPPGASLKPGDVLSAAYDDQRQLYLCARRSSSQSVASVGALWVFDATGTLARTDDIQALAVMPATGGRVALVGAASSPRSQHLFVKPLRSDGLDEPAAYLRTEQPAFAPGRFLLHSSGMLFAMDDVALSRFAPDTGAPDGLPSYLNVRVHPASSGIVATYDEASATLALYGQAQQRKPLAARARLLATLGKLLARKPGVAYERLRRSTARLIVKGSAEVADTRAQPPGDGIAVVVQAALKRLHLNATRVRSIAVARGDEPGAIGAVRVDHSLVGALSCRSLRSLDIRGNMTGAACAWFGDLGQVAIAGDCAGAVLTARVAVEGVTAGGNIAMATVRSGYSPLGFAGGAGSIAFIRARGSIENCTFVACADEGPTPGWMNDAAGAESSAGSIVELRAGLFLPQRAWKLPRRGSIAHSLLVTRQPILRLFGILSDCTYIVNGQPRSAP